jgi:hypothetical protein
MGYGFGSETWCFQCATGSDAPATGDSAIEYGSVLAYNSTPIAFPFSLGGYGSTC